MSWWWAGLGNIWGKTHVAFYVAGLTVLWWISIILYCPVCSPFITLSGTCPQGYRTRIFSGRQGTWGSTPQVLGKCSGISSHLWVFSMYCSRNFQCSLPGHLLRWSASSFFWLGQVVSVDLSYWASIFPIPQWLEPCFPNQCWYIFGVFWSVSWRSSHATESNIARSKMSLLA